jgi:hypothetical protein
MATINMLRGLLVAGAAFAALLAALYGQWSAVLLLVVGIAAHGALWVHLHRTRDAVPPEAG